MVGCLIRGVLTAAESVATVDTFSTFVTAYVLRQTQLPARPEYDSHVELRKMREALEAGEFPSLVQALDEGDLMDYDAEFEFGLRALARGFADVAAKRTAE